MSSKARAQSSWNHRQRPLCHAWGQCVAVDIRQQV